jgi:polar amino acid transport system ATP-binding protein
MKLSIRSAYKKFGSTTVLDGVNLEVSCRIMGLAGPSGGGKSTLLRCIQGLDTLDSGTIEHAGKAGFMFQDFQLFPHITVLRNITYAIDLQEGSSHKTQAMDLLQKLGMADKADAYPRQLSGGQKQRVALARSLIMKPDLLLCDEPTSGLDVATIDEVIDLLRSVSGVMIIIASHDLDLLTRICDEIVVLRGGRIVHKVIDVGAVEHSSLVLKLRGFYA